MSSNNSSAAPMSQQGCYHTIHLKFSMEPMHVGRENDKLYTDEIFFTFQKDSVSLTTKQDPLNTETLYDESRDSFSVLNYLSSVREYSDAIAGLPKCGLFKLTSDGIKNMNENLTAEIQIGVDPGVKYNGFSNVFLFHWTLFKKPEPDENPYIFMAIDLKRNSARFSSWSPNFLNSSKELREKLAQSKITNTDSSISISKEAGQLLSKFEPLLDGVFNGLLRALTDYHLRTINKNYGNSASIGRNVPIDNKNYNGIGANIIATTSSFHLALIKCLLGRLKGNKDFRYGRIGGSLFVSHSSQYLISGWTGTLTIKHVAVTEESIASSQKLYNYNESSHPPRFLLFGDAHCTII